MKSRTCPNCTYRYSRKEYFRFYFKGVDSEWTCKNCGIPLKLNVKRRTTNAFISMIPLFIGFVAIPYTHMVLSISIFWHYGILIALLLIWSVWIHGFDKFDIDNER